MFALVLWLAHFCSCITMLTVAVIARTLPAFAYKLFYGLVMSCPFWEEIGHWIVTWAPDSNGDFKAALFQVASSVGFLSHFGWSIPSMFNNEVKSWGILDRYVTDIYLLASRSMLTVNSHSTRVVFVVFFMAYNKTFPDRSTVNSLVSDHPWCTTKWSLTGGGRLWEKSTK